MNWGNKLLVVFAMFGCFILYMVYRCTQTQVDLVSKEYYKDELAYQNVIDGKNNADMLNNKVSVTQDANNVAIQFPDEMRGENVTGSIWFYAPANAKNDLQVALKTNGTLVQQVSKQSLQPGKYTVKISWQEADKKFYTEQPLTISK
jgi:nitrogen fixation protein FixH